MTVFSKVLCDRPEKENQHKASQDDDQGEVRTGAGITLLSLHRLLCVVVTKRRDTVTELTEHCDVSADLRYLEHSTIQCEEWVVRTQQRC